jgi:serine/threonine protein kinase
MNTLAYKDDDKRAIDHLVGLKLKDGWIISEKLTRGARQSGSHFSVGYIATREGERAFMKAFDFQRAFENDNPMKAIELLSKSYNFEVEVLQLCKERNMKKIVRAVADGVADHPDAPAGKIYYLLFELAEGDVRADFNFDSTKSIVWQIKCLHEIATGLQQLHRRGIFHQDVKPSNILVFNRGAETKLGDLGRAHCTGKSAPHDERKIAGAYSYAPPELLYDAPLEDRKSQRACADLYLFGSMIYFFATGVALTPALIKSLRTDHRPFLAPGHGWNGTFKDVLPYLIEAHATLLAGAKKELTSRLPIVEGADLAQKIVDLMKYASFPDPAERGHPSARRIVHGNPYDLERFITAFDVIWSRAKFAMRKNA